jgi:hypothetical protein
MPGDTTQPTPGMPDAYRRWRSSRLGHTTDTLKERLIVGLAGPPSGRRILDAGRGGAVLAMALAKRGAIVTSVDADQRMLAARRGAGGSVICVFGRWSLWAAKRRASGWLGSHTRRRATFRSAHAKAS